MRLVESWSRLVSTKRGLFNIGTKRVNSEDVDRAEYQQMMMHLTPPAEGAGAWTLGHSAGKHAREASPLSGDHKPAFEASPLSGDHKPAFPPPMLDAATQRAVQHNSGESEFCSGRNDAQCVSHSWH